MKWSVKLATDLYSIQHIRYKTFLTSIARIRLHSCASCQLYNFYVQYCEVLDIDSLMLCLTKGLPYSFALYSSSTVYDLSTAGGI